MKKREGYVITEAAVLLPLASILILMLVYLCSYLYQGCFLTQAAYAAAFRGSRYPENGAEYVEYQLEELMNGQILSFGPEERTVEHSPFAVSVKLSRDTPFLKFGDRIPKLSASWKIRIRDPVAYIRSLKRIREGSEENG